jgi:FkbM family methyltransferase
MQAERRLHEFLHCPASDIRKIAIVGANLGEELDGLARTYPNASFVCFEPSPKYFPSLSEKFRNHPRIECRKTACGEKPGTCTFYELPMDGNGSLLKPDVDAWKTFNNWEDGTVTEYQVEVSTLDAEIPGKDPLDLLWVDVQGAEKQVLLGGSSLLGRTRAVFLEVAIGRNPYEGGSLIEELDRLLRPAGHVLVELGTDPWNFTGNALWIRNPAALVCT